MISRRAVLSGGLGLAACVQETPESPPSDISLRDMPFPVGSAMMTGHIENEGFLALARRHISQVTPEWEMKMEYILQPDGSLRLDASDRIADFARREGMRLHGHTLIWYADEGGGAFERLEDDTAAFARAYRDYILAVAGRYRGVARSWDVVNEPIDEVGQGYRSSIWSRSLGEIDHILRAFDHAAEADPDAILFLNDYHLENIPRKRRWFMRLVETLLSRGCKLGGLGTQTHLDIDMEPGKIKAAISDLATFGLPIHLSELDISTHMKDFDLRSMPDRLRRQAAVAREAAEAFVSLPPRQRFAFSLWGLRDSDSWLRGPSGTSPDDQPALFARDGSPKPAFAAVAEVFAGAA